MPRPLHLGLYVHDRGHGSRSRAAALLDHLEGEVTLLTALEASQLPFGRQAPIVPLAPSVEPPPGQPPTSPRHCGVSRSRARAVLGWLEQEEPDLLVVDGCVGLAGLAHLAGVPTVGVRVLGAPWPAWGDAPLHTVAPYPAHLDLDEVPDGVREHTTYVGGYSALDGLLVDRDDARTTYGLDTEQPVVTVMAGAEGLGREAERRLLEAAAANRRWQWLVVGTFVGTDGVVPDNLHRLGWLVAPLAPLAAADVVVSAGGDATAADVASVRRPHVVIQDAEAGTQRNAAVAQLVRGRVLTALPMWPGADAWAELLSDVRELDLSAQHDFCDHDGARRLATELGALAERATATPLAMA